MEFSRRIEAAMARKPRVEYVGAFYHVICRGNQRQVIFSRDADRKYYLAIRADFDMLDL